MSYACRNCGTVIMEDDENLCAKCKPAEPAPAEQGEELIKADKATESAIMLIDTLDMNGLAGTGGLLTREIRRLRALLAAERGRAERAEAVSEEEYSRGFNNGARASHSALVAIIEDKEKDIEVAEAEAKALREALDEAAIALETLAHGPWRDLGLTESIPNIRAYAHGQATKARAALAPSEGKA